MEVLTITHYTAINKVIEVSLNHCPIRTPSRTVTAFLRTDFNLIKIKAQEAIKLMSLSMEYMGPMIHTEPNRLLAHNYTIPNFLLQRHRITISETALNLLHLLMSRLRLETR
jgi:hypothetical protein